MLSRTVVNNLYIYRSFNLKLKAQLRKIVINNVEYLYRIRLNYYSPANTNKLTVKIFKSQQKATPLVIDFLTTDDYLLGNPLNAGVTLPNSKANKEVRLNLNEPQYMRELVLLGLKNGWTGINKLPVQNGLQYLTELGFDVSSIMPRL